MLMSISVIADIIVDTVQCNKADVVTDARLADLGVDSLKAITVLYELEEAFDIEIPNEVIEQIETVGDIVAKVDALRAAQAA